MLVDEKKLSTEERATLALRSLYEKYGYLPYKMTKFEEYDLYVKNRDFLVSDNLITFTDTNGRLMALKPDVTLSIIKNLGSTGSVKKLYYNENVYRTSGWASGTEGTFREIMQVGLECIGDIDTYSVSEVLMLAAMSLKCISGESILDISHLGVLEDVFSCMGISAEAEKKIFEHADEKSASSIREICLSDGCTGEDADALASVMAEYGRPGEVMDKIGKLFGGIAGRDNFRELEAAVACLSSAGVTDMIRMDPGLVEDIRYYNGVVMKGYIKGVPQAVLSGGQYDKLLRRMGKDQKAIGFAVYMDTLERLRDASGKYDVDLLISYSDRADPETVMKEAAAAVAKGWTVRVAKGIPEGVRYRTMKEI